MPVAKYSVKTTNRFQLADSGSDSGSDDEATNIDPFAMIRQAEVDAIKQAKQDIKNSKKKVVPTLEPATEKVEEKAAPARRNNNRREPRGNQAARRGPRNERPERTENSALSENNNNQASRDDGNRRPRRPRDQDRRSGNPRSGVKATEKKGGAGAGNWGKADENLDETAKEAISEEKSAENAENADPEEVVEAEPEEVTLSLEEYYAQLGKAEAVQTASRKANNGEALKGKTIRRNKIFTDKKNQQTVNTQPKESNKVILPNEKLSFISGRNDNRRDDRNNNRRGGRGGRRSDNQAGDNKRQPKEFNMEKVSQDFPKLGGK